MVINTNTYADNIVRGMAAANLALSKSIQRVSSGIKTSSPDADPAGLSVATRFESQIKQTNAAARNVSDATSMVQTRDGYLNQVGNALDRMAELALLAQDSTKTDADRAVYDKEFQDLTKYVTEVGSKDFNGVSMFSGAAQTVEINQMGRNLSIEGVNLGAKAYTEVTKSGLGSASAASAALEKVRAASVQLGYDRASNGTSLARLSVAGEELSITQMNLNSATRSIRDADMADESINLAKYDILQRTSTAMLAQANTAPQSLLSLFR